MAASVLMAGTAAAAAAAPGDLDASYDGDGKETINYDGPDRADAVLVQPDGKIVIAGPPRSDRPSTCAPAPARYRGSPKAPASTKCCATCAASGATSRSSSTSTAPSSACSRSKTCSKSSSAKSTTNSTPPPSSSSTERTASYGIDGSVPVRLVARELGLTLDAPHETTLNGHLIEHLGRVPHPGETVELDGARLEGLTGDDTEISQVAVRSAPRPPQSTE
jgi:hypothetical protein